MSDNDLYMKLIKEHRESTKRRAMIWLCVMLFFTAINYAFVVTGSGRIFIMATALTWTSFVAGSFYGLRYFGTPGYE